MAPGIERVLSMLAQQAPRADVLEPFVQAARDVVAQECGSEVVPGKLTITNAADTTLEVTVVIGITGRLTGIAVYGMSEEMAMAIVGKMLGSPVDELDDMAISGIAELANVITGHASTLLTGMGLHCDISTPTVLLGAGSRLSTGKIMRLVMPLNTDLGVLHTQVAVKVTGAKTF
ncbi:MAG: chemotaxis protein CheX [Chloroflexota bacterium]